MLLKKLTTITWLSEMADVIVNKGFPCESEKLQEIEKVQK